MRALVGINPHRWLLGLAALCLSACVTLISQYDEKIDEMATAIQREISAEMETLSTQQAPACLYPQHADFYRQVKVDVGALAVRAGAHDLNELTIGQVQALRDALGDFEKIHLRASSAPRCLSAAEISPAARGLDQIVGAILRLELAKKRGK